MRESFVTFVCVFRFGNSIEIKPSPHWRINQKTKKKENDLYGFSVVRASRHAMNIHF